MQPISLSSLTIGTASTVRKPASSTLEHDDRISIDVTLLQHDVGDMDRPPGRDDLRKSGSRRGTKLRFTPAKLGKGGRGVVQCDDAKPFSIVEIKRAELAFADARRIRQHGLEHRLPVHRANSR